MEFDQTHWVPIRQRGPLPTFYYHEHFTELLDFVEAYYAHVLLDEHLAYIDDFRALPRTAQCLYVRLANRKGKVFATRRLRYPELGELAPIVGRLEAEGWVGQPAVEYFEALLGFVTRDDIYRLLLPRFAGLSRSLKKEELVDFARRNLAPADLVDGLEGSGTLVQLRIDATDYLLFLYFGRVRDGLSEFTMRDLGLVRTQNLSDSYEPRFADRPEALEHYYFARRLKCASGAGAAELAPLIAEAGGWPATNFPRSAAMRDELAYRLGRKAEQHRNADAAIGLYALGESAQCSERLVRLLLAKGARDAAREHLERCLEDPRSDEEWLIARDLFERKFEKKRTSRLTDLLRASETVAIDESQSATPERAVIAHFEKQGQAAYRSENLLWRTLFGLLFWEELFAAGESALNSPFEFLPASLSNGTFYAANRERIEGRLALLADRAAAKRAILHVSSRHYGTHNGVFRWRQSMADALFALLDHAPADATATVLRQFCRDYADSRYGYPDLLVIDADGTRFVEVKTDGDQLRRNQLLRIRQLRAAGFRADVVRVRWILDPEQTYVVVDVETTGGRGEHHRVTEIGAVKVRNGEVVDRFNTLLNPQRAIPANISRLTGITPAMVAAAPYFADIADEFEDFMRDAIFVAHNVEFDYGFIASEFRRIGRRFRHPRLCTCAAMRKLYPGRRSYSLASLCREFNVPLRQHHRALCDAEAASELLLLINEKRQEL